MENNVNLSAAMQKAKRRDAIFQIGPRADLNGPRPDLNGTRRP